ncbi:hypothetical protein [Streptomyces sp. NBC_01363]|uniref:hypothetical protein n=1 Tax=Streptomyces sp. NBC_01363 TaxID=2903840 RepID=UPI0022595CE5|nr:hypothetical protein [Streptomyces sp. NBC_01363]MCX4732286.1 hypothetical protein [Streptomyces sp. NBC_01363]
MDFEIRENRGRSQGRKPLVREREEYFRLMEQGLSSREACRAVGINLRTGKRWRNGRGATTGEKARPSIRRPISPDGPSRYLREADRLHIADRLIEKASSRITRSPAALATRVNERYRLRGSIGRPVRVVKT